MSVNKELLTIDLREGEYYLVRGKVIKVLETYIKICSDISSFNICAINMISVKQITNSRGEVYKSSRAIKMHCKFLTTPVIEEDLKILVKECAIKISTLKKAVEANSKIKNQTASTY